MILVIGIIFLDWSHFFLFPSKMNLIYGYCSYLAKQNERNWRHAQKLCARYFLLLAESWRSLGLS